MSAVREAARLIAEDERLTPVLVPLGDGILVAAWDEPDTQARALRYLCTLRRRVGVPTRTPRAGWALDRRVEQVFSMPNMRSAD